MKVLKPQRLGIVTRVVEHERRCSLAIGVLAYVPMRQPRHLLAEQALWKEGAESIAGGVIDEATPKPCGEVLVSGSAFAPGGRATGVRLRLTASRAERTLLDKHLVAIGNRYWIGSKPSDPAPFASIPVDLAHAFGGEGFALNPHGKGAAPVVTEHGEVIPLPNLEDPSQPVSSPRDRPRPVTFGPLDVTLPQRQARMGSRYDETWLKTRFPGPAEDFDAHFYNVAHDDQWIDGFFDETERFVVEGMHPEKARVEMTLSPLVVRAFVTQATDDGERFLDVRTRLDTVHLLPHLERAILIYRGVLEVAEDDADDIVHLMIAAEAPEAPKPIDHYREALALRLDKDKGALAMMKDRDLLPPPVEGWTPSLEVGDLGDLTRLEMRQLDNMDRGRKVKLEAAKAELEAAGFDAGDSFEETELPRLADPFDMDAALEHFDELEKRGEEAQRELAEKKDELEKEARHAFAEMGLDYDVEAEKAQAEGGGPPSFSAEEHLAMLADMARIAREGGQPLPDLERDLGDPRFVQTIVDLEQRARESYVKFAHVMPAASTDEEAARMLRVRVVAAKEAGESMAGQNLIGADLHDLDLGEMDFADALLEKADLSGADLSGANLRGAVLARSTLDRACFMDADLTGANLGSTTLTDTDLSGAVIDEVVFMWSELRGVHLTGARGRGITFLETTFSEADFSHAMLDEAVFMQCDLRNAIFTGAELPTARFLEVDVRGVDFTGARMNKAQFLKCQGDGASFAGANLEEAVFVYEASFEDCSFAGARLAGANLRKTPLARGDFRGAVMHRADLSGCDLRGANLHRIVAHQALMVRTDFSNADLRGADLLGAILQKARLYGADLRGVNLSRADVSLVRTDRGTQLKDALMLNTRVDPQYQERR